MTRVKICGITRTEDALLAADLGAVAVGFVFWPRSPRRISVETAREIASVLPAFVIRVGVFVNAAPAEVAGAVDAVRLDAVQLHGEERVEDFAGVGARLVKTVLLDSDEAIDRARSLPPSVTPLVDAADRVRRGGTGERADWSRAARVSSARPIVLAGGLTADNVGEAIAIVRPFAVDVASGVELSPGIKSCAKIRDFIDAVTDQSVRERTSRR